MSHSVIKEASPLIREVYECINVIPDNYVYTIAINSVHVQLLWIYDC